MCVHSTYTYGVGAFVFCDLGDFDLGTLLTLGDLVSLGSLVFLGDLVSLGSLVFLGDLVLVFLGDFVSLGSLVPFGLLLLLEGALLFLGALVFLGLGSFPLVSRSNSSSGGSDGVINLMRASALPTKANIINTVRNTSRIRQ